MRTRSVKLSAHACLKEMMQNCILVPAHNEFNEQQRARFYHFISLAIFQRLIYSLSALAHWDLLVHEANILSWFPWAHIVAALSSSM